MPARFSLLFAALALQATALDLTNATVALLGPERAAAELLVTEAERRTGIRWRLTDDPRLATIILGQRKPVAAALNLSPGGAAPAEGFTSGIANGRVYVAGNDARGVLYGVGHLLRKMEMRRNSAILPEPYSVTTAPTTRLRGHQLGYRPKTNSYDGWDLAQWQRYIGELALFGANAIELIPPRSDDAPDSPHFPRPQMEMMIGMAEYIHRLGLEVWIWYPAMDDDYTDAKTVEFALKEWGGVFAKLPRVDAILVPAGDPGHTPAPVLLPFLAKQAANLRKYHPSAQMWLAPQGFDRTSADFFFEQMKTPPAWLTGIVYGPQTRFSLAELRQKLRNEIPIRHYPDITHSRQAQYPVPGWDVAWALTSAREPVNPRPVDQAKIFRAQQKHTVGFIAYSEGCNDDVNKAVWSGLGWDANADVTEILRDYSRLFIGPDFADDFAQGLLALERNWRGPALTNSDVPNTLAQFQSMERRALPPLLLNWRFQQGLYRAYYDAYVQRRLLRETATEREALDALESGRLGDAERILDRVGTVAPELRTRVFQLAEALYQSIRMQLAVVPYGAMNGRGNTLDTVDFPLNARAWLKEQIARIRALPPADRPAAIQRVVHWTDPGPGGFYDDLGDPANQPRLVPGAGFDEDPQYFRTPLVFFATDGRGPKSWWTQIAGLYEQPVRLRYTDLERTAKYKVRVVYGAGPLKLTAGQSQIHDYLTKPFEPLEFDLPDDAASSGALTLEWSRPPGAGGAGRGNQIAEVWLVKRR